MDPARVLDLPDGVPPLCAFYLYLSNSCNLACRHCWIVPHFVDGRPSPGDVIDPELLRRAVCEAKPLGLSSAKLTGGEPMLHPHFVELVDMLSAEELELSMETNGTLLSAEVARHLKTNTRLRFISISLDGADAATHDRFRQMPGAWEAALRGLSYLVEAGYTNTQLIMSVHRGNVAQVEALVQLAAERGAGSVKFNPVMSVGRGIAMHQHGETLDVDEILALAAQLRALRKQVPLRLILHLPLALQSIEDLLDTGAEVGDCGVLSILGILGSGEIALCGIGRTIPELVYGHLGQSSIRDIWLHHPRLLELCQLLSDAAHYPGVCGVCVVARRCRTGCVADNYAHSGHLVWPNPWCTEAERRGFFPTSRLKTGTRGG
ncbi:MAG: radical SAM protein [Anaerolineae bacterium]|nr:radical SAM protein [Anaerolineae bacterium]